MSKNNPTCYRMIIKKSKEYQRKKLSVKGLPQKENQVFKDDVEDSTDGGEYNMNNCQDQRRKIIKKGRFSGWGN